MLTEEDKNRCRSHLGYGQVMASQTFVQGVPAGVQTQFVIEGAMTRLLPSAEQMLRKWLDRLDSVEERIDDSTEDVLANKIGNIELNDKALQRLVDRYRYWQGKVCNLLQVQPNPYDQRPYLGMGWGAGSGVNVPVQHG